MSTFTFADRHIGPDATEQQAMLDALGLPSLDALIKETVPADIRLTDPLPLPPAESEQAYLERMRRIAAENQWCKTYIGLGYYDCVTPSVILRTVFENPSWYTPYTPYQAEIAQGRLELLMNFQTMVMDLTGMDMANASLLDEASAGAEAMTLLHRTRPRRGKQRDQRNRFWVSDRVFPQTLAVLRTRAEPLGIELRVGDLSEIAWDDETFGALIAYPDAQGTFQDWRNWIATAHESGIRVAVATDLMALTRLSPPGEMGADVVFGSAQRFGVPLGYGGPHAAFFAVTDALKREVPGRIIGLSVDRHGTPAYRLALQTREQHIRREKATSNICTAQALLANMAALYAIYHGPDGLAAIASAIHERTVRLYNGLAQRGFTPVHSIFFDTLYLRMEKAEYWVQRALDAGINLRYDAPDAIGISLDETTTNDDVDRILSIFADATSAATDAPALSTPAWPTEQERQSAYLTHPVFSAHRSETKMMRYIKQLERKDLGLDTSMIPLGSCTMKLNAATEMIPVSWPEFSRLHPFVPRDQAAGYTRIIDELEQALAVITGLDAVSLQPNSGAQGEYAGLLAIRAWHLANGQAGRDIALIPTSAHGTNPASAVMAGMQVVMVQCDAEGAIDQSDLTAKIESYKDRLAVLMITYPSTYGVFEEGIAEICNRVHACGGQVYMDGANLNAQVGLTSPGRIGADVCHINLHKTFSIPHGGGGPGMGPIAVAQHLTPYLPKHPWTDEATNEDAPITIAAAPWGSASILLISYAYVRLLGAEGITHASRIAILNANYIKHRLEPYFDVHYSGRNQRVAHELIFDFRPFKDRAGITETDVAKRLMDYGFHAPTVSWPVPGTLMVEPTESESQAELDTFCDAMIAIHGEIEAIILGRSDRENNVLRMAPHTAADVCADEWPHPYTRTQAAYPLPFVRQRKFWPAVSRIDNAYGDRNLVCACAPVEPVDPS